MASRPPSLSWPEGDAEEEFSGNAGGDSFFGSPIQGSSGEDSGRLLAAYETPNELDGEAEVEPLHFECVSPEWAERIPCCMGCSLSKSLSEDAGLAVLELDRAPNWVLPAAPGTISWYVVEFTPAPRSAADGRIYWNLFSDGTPVVVKGEPADVALIKKIKPGLLMDDLQLESPALDDGDSYLPEVSRCSGVAIYDVGQGAWQGIIDPETQQPVLYVDVGGGVLYNRRTFPKEFSRPPGVQTIILSHWDWDHWSSARRFTSLMNAHWIAPPVPAKPIQTRVALDIRSRGRLTILPLPQGKSLTAGCISLERCTGTTENDRGLAVTVRSRPKNGRTCLLPGDAAYRYIPSVASAASAAFNAICMSHHGGRLHSKHYPKPKARAFAANSAGPGNTYKHPLFKTLQAHKGAGWPLPIQTGTSGSRPCHVFLPWGMRPQLIQGDAAMEV